MIAANMGLTVFWVFTRRVGIQVCFSPCRKTAAAKNGCQEHVVSSIKLIHGFEDSWLHLSLSCLVRRTRQFQASTTVLEA